MLRILFQSGLEPPPEMKISSHLRYAERWGISSVLLYCKKYSLDPGCIFLDCAEKKYFDTELKIVYNIMMCVYRYITIFW